jgi:hypothetical protein
MEQITYEDLKECEQDLDDLLKRISMTEDEMMNTLIRLETIENRMDNLTNLSPEIIRKMRRAPNFVR